MSRLWLKEIRGHRIARQRTETCAWGDERAALLQITKALDLPMPIWLSKHEKEWERYRRTAFLPEHFVEGVDFDCLEIEFLGDEEKKSVSRDPRNQF